MSAARKLTSVLVVVGFVAACGGGPEPAPAPTPTPAAAPARPAPQQTTTSASADADRARREREAALARARETLAEMVFFDYDRSDIRADQRAILDRKVAVLREQPAVRIRIGGHADERGSTEYNLALGSRRAESVRAYMAGYGISQNRLEIVSYGEERPLVQGRNEQSWSRNRRADFAVTAGLAAGQ